MTKLQIKALEEGIQLIKSATLPFPAQRGDTKEDFELNWNCAIGERDKARNKISKGLEWIQAATDDGKQ